MGIGRPSRIDVAYAAAVAVPIVVLTIFTWLGSSFAAYALAFVVGALLGSLAARLMTAPEAPGWLRVVAVLLAALSIVVVALEVASPFIAPGWLGVAGELDDRDAVPGSFFLGGFAFLFFTEIFRRVALPSLYPSTFQEDQQRNQEQLRQILIIGGIVLALIIGALVIFGVLVLIAYMVGQFSS